jgi:hypothetical protein
VTPTLKLRRPFLEAHYARFIPEWTAANHSLIWYKDSE